MDKGLSISQIALKLGIPERTAYHLAKTDPNLKAAKVGRHIRVMESDLHDWIDKNKIHKLVTKNKEDER